MTDPIEEARALLKNATPGPWTAREGVYPITVRDLPLRRVADTYCNGNAALIAAAPRLLAALIVELELLRGTYEVVNKEAVDAVAECDRLRAELAAVTAERHAGGDPGPSALGACEVCEGQERPAAVVVGVGTPDLRRLCVECLLAAYVSAANLYKSEAIAHADTRTRVNAGVADDRSVRRIADLETRVASVSASHNRLLREKEAAEAALAAAEAKLAAVAAERDTLAHRPNSCEALDLILNAVRQKERAEAAESALARAMEAMPHDYEVGRLREAVRVAYLSNERRREAERPLNRLAAYRASQQQNGVDHG